MSETIPTTTLETESRWDEPQPDSTETEDTPEVIPEWYRETLGLIIANADVVGPCKWMGNEELRLGTAMWKHARPTPENVHLVHANVLEFLANAANKKAQEEENPEEEQPEEVEVGEEQEAGQKEEKNQKNNTETENPKTPEESKTQDIDRQPHTITVIAEHQQHPVSNVGVPDEPKTNNVKAIEAGTVHKPVLSELKQPSPVATKAEAGIAANTIPESPTPEVVTNEIPEEIRAVVIPIEDQPSEMGAFVDLTPEDMPALDISEPETKQEIEPTNMSVELEVAPEPEPTELSALDFEVVTDLDDRAEIIDEEVELEIDEMQMFYQPIWEGATDRSEAEEALPVVQNNLTIEEIEDSLTALSEAVEASEPETLEEINIILDKIVEVPTKLEANDEGDVISEAQAQEELKKLFTELLNKMNIDYTPELIESLANLTLSQHLVDEIERPNDKGEIDKVPNSGGTHEIIRKLLAGLSTIKKAITHACVIGKSALQLYSVNFAA